QNGAHVTLVFPDDVLGASQFPPSIAQRYQKLFTDHGVELLPGRRAAQVTVQDDADVGVTLDDGTAVGGDVVVIGLGAEPRLDLARQAGLEVSEGVVVDEHLRTSDPAIWAAGDLIEYPGDVAGRPDRGVGRSEEHTSGLQSRFALVCRLLLEKKKSQAVPSH